MMLAGDTFTYLQSRGIDRDRALSEMLDSFQTGQPIRLPVTAKTEVQLWPARNNAGTELAQRWTLRRVAR